MSETTILWLFGILFAGITASHGAIWYQLGQLRKSQKCPFGNCPVFDRAKKEAAPTREVERETNETA